MGQVLGVRMLPIAKLKPAPYNPRLRLKADDPRYKKLARSLREFGLVEPLIWNEKTGYLVGGHARLAILKSMKIKKVAVSVVRLDPAREKALNVVLNNLEAQGRYDPERLAEVLEGLANLPELELTGFSTRDLADLRLSPLDELPANVEANAVEVTLSMDTETYDRAASKLDELVREFDLVSHVVRK